MESGTDKQTVNYILVNKVLLTSIIVRKYQKDNLNITKKLALFKIVTKFYTLFMMTSISK